MMAVPAGDVQLRACANMNVMTFRWLMIVTIAGLASTAPRAADQVTFFLSNGDSVSGDVASTSEASASLPRGGLHLKRGTVDRSFGRDLVAVIAWVTGQPSPQELKGLPGDGHMVVLRNGTSQPGRMTQLTPDMLRWITARGTTEDIRVADVARIYLNPVRAREMFHAKPGAAAAAAAVSRQVSVPGNQAWTDSGLDVRDGDRITVAATGQIRLSANRTHIAGPGGAGAIRSPNYPVPAVPAGALIGRVGDGAPFLIGLGRASIAISGNGRLHLGINDDDVRDNSGAFEVRIQR
jgi:hypothetical protein